MRNRIIKRLLPPTHAHKKRKIKYLRTSLAFIFLFPLVAMALIDSIPMRIQYFCFGSRNNKRRIIIVIKRRVLYSGSNIDEEEGLGELNQTNPTHTIVQRWRSKPVVSLFSRTFRLLFYPTYSYSMCLSYIMTPYPSLFVIFLFQSPLILSLYISM